MKSISLVIGLTAVLAASARGQGLEKVIQESPVQAPAGAALKNFTPPVATGIAVSASDQKAAAGNTEITLQCREIACHDVEKPTNQPATWCGDDLGKTVPLTIRKDYEADKKTGKIEVNLSEGDQTYFFTYFKDDALKLFTEQVKEIPVTYTDGFWWSDGDHVRYTIDYLCRL
jgi:hypothetical protein